MSRLSRRAFLRKAAVATTAVAAAGTASALASQGEADDSAIFALAAEFDAAHREMKACEPIHTAAEDRYFDLKPEKPERPDMPDDVRRAFNAVTVGDFWALTTNDEHPYRHRSISADAAHAEALARHKAADEQAEVESGLAVAAEVWEGLVGKVQEIADRLTEQPAYTLSGSSRKRAPFWTGTRAWLLNTVLASSR